MSVPLLTAWWHCGSRLLQTSTAQAFAVFSLSVPFPLSPVILNRGHIETKANSRLVQIPILLF